MERRITQIIRIKGGSRSITSELLEKWSVDSGQPDEGSPAGAGLLVYFRLDIRVVGQIPVPVLKINKLYKMPGDYPLAQ